MTIDVSAETVPDYMVSEPGAAWISPLGLEKSVERLLDIGDGEKIADLGAGKGELSKRIAKRRPEAEIVATEFSSVSAEEAYRNTMEYENIDVIRTDKFKGLEEGSFEQIYAINSVQAMENPLEGIEEMSRTLESDGTAVVTVPREESAEIFPDEWVQNKNGSTYIEGEAVLPKENVTYSQYIFPRSDMERKLKSSDLEPRNGYPESVLSDPTGLPYLSDIIPEEAEMDVPRSFKTALRYTPSTLTRKIVEKSGIGPEVDLWVADRV